VTLYDNETIRFKQRLFNEWIVQNNAPLPEEVIDFHTTAGQGDPENDFVMNRNNKVKTVSITQVLHDHNSLLMKHVDLLNARTADLVVA
jgi:hypothetical protein